MKRTHFFRVEVENPPKCLHRLLSWQREHSERTSRHEPGIGVRPAQTKSRERKVKWFLPITHSRNGKILIWFFCRAEGSCVDSAEANSKQKADDALSASRWAPLCTVVEFRMHVLVMLSASD